MVKASGIEEEREREREDKRSRVKALFGEAKAMIEIIGGS